MKNYLKSDLQGRNFFKTYILYFLIFLFTFAITTAFEDEVLVSNFFSFLSSFVSALLCYVILNFIISGLSFKDSYLKFEANIKEFAPKVLLWTFLSFITLGLYAPWYYKNVISYYLERTSYMDNRAEFKGNPTQLLKYMLLMLYLPVFILVILSVLISHKTVSYMNYSAANNFWSEIIVAFIIIIFVLLIVFVVCQFYFIKWFVNFRYNQKNVLFTKSFSETIYFLIPQFLLSLVTIGIYYPAMLIKMSRFILEGSIISTETDEKQGGFEFSGETGAGFCLIWGQLLLSFITVGIYGPWAISKVSNWFINNTAIIDCE